MNYINFFTILLLFTLLHSCTSNKDNKIPEELLKEIRAITTLSDSLMTYEQRETKYKITIIMKAHLKVENNHVKFTGSYKDFTDKDLSKHYYDYIQKSVKELNTYIDSKKIENVSKLLEEGMLQVFN